MRLNSLDWTVLAAYGALVLAVGLVFARRAGAGTGQFFLAGRNLPWWLLGTSMVATTFSTDTPNLVTDLVRNGGVAGNWMWWAFLITGMCTTFFYAKLWRRSGVFTDIGFYELRYSGRAAVFLRGFRAVYLGVFFNVMIMAAVLLAGIKIGGVLLGADKYTTVLVAAAVTAVYSATSGLWGVVVTDLMLFVIAMTGSVAAAWYALAHPAVGGISGLVTNPDIAARLALLPDFADWETAATVFLIPIAVQWWSTWYPGAEPGGGGYAAQRMLAARSERDSMGATLWFNIAHYALRPWPWILVALASLVVYPTLDSIAEAFPHLDPSIIRHDLAYPAMLVFLPHGLLGLVVASLAAALMSTISTHLNWGASYIVDDVYRRFVRPGRGESHYVLVARLSTIALVALAAVVALWLENAMQAFQILLQIGAGTGLIFLLRWFWWRINAAAELAAMVCGFVVGLCTSVVPLLVIPDYGLRLMVTTGLTAVVWIVVMLITPAESAEVMERFVRQVQPPGPGWRQWRDRFQVDVVDSLGELIRRFLLSSGVLFGALLGSGAFLLHQSLTGWMGLTLAVLCGFPLLRTYGLRPRRG